MWLKRVRRMWTVVNMMNIAYEAVVFCSAPALYMCLGWFVNDLCSFVSCVPIISSHTADFYELAKKGVRIEVLHVAVINANIFNFSPEALASLFLLLWMHHIHTQTLGDTNVFKLGFRLLEVYWCIRLTMNKSDSHYSQWCIWYCTSKIL